MKRLAVVVGALAPAAVAQADWYLDGAAARVRIAGPVVHWLEGPRATVSALPAGDYEVHFAADAAGKPRSLAFAVAGDEVRLAVEPAGALPAGGAGIEGDTNYRVTGIAAPGTGGEVGLEARRDEASAYRFVWDRAGGVFRLERVLGGEALEIARAEAPRGDDAEHALALQVDGFRVEAWWDEAIVLRALDGAVSRGDIGAFAAGGAAAPEVRREAVARPRDSGALVIGPGAATFHAAVTVVPGHFHVLELALDRPHPPLPLDANGLEPPLMCQPAQPIVAWADGRNSPGRGGIGVIGVDGTFASEVQWPPFAVLDRQFVWVRALLVTPDGSTVAGRTPSLPLCFR